MSYKTNSGNADQIILEEIADAYSQSFPENLYRLIKYFSHADWLMRKYASEYAAKLGERIIEPLFDELDDEDASDDKIYWGLKTLIKLLNDTNIETVSICLSELIEKFSGLNVADGNNRLIYLIKAAAHTKSEKSTLHLIELLGHEKWIVRNEAAGAILSIGKSAAPALKAAFFSGNKDIRYWTVKLLGQLLGAGALESFKKLLKSDKKDLRYYALTALGEIESDEALGHITDCLSDPSWLVRAQAAEILEKKGSVSLKYLKAVFEKSDNPDVKYWTVKVLTRFLNDETISYLEKSLETEDSELKYCVIEAFSNIKFSKVAPILLKLLDDPAWLVRKHVASVFSKFGSQASAFLARVIENETSENIRYWAVQIIAKSDGNNFAELLKLLKDTSRSERVFIIQSLREIKNLAALPALFDLLLDEQWIIRREAAHAIAEYSPDDVVGFIVENLSQMKPDVKFWMQKIMSLAEIDYATVISRQIKNAGNEGDAQRLERLYGFLELGNPQKSVEIILELLKGRKNDTKELVVASLRDIKSESFANCLLKALGSEEAGVSFWLAQIIKNISKNLYHTFYSALDDNNAEKRVWICKIFAEIKDAAFIAPLMMLLSNENKNVRFEATRALAKFDSYEVFECLIKRYIDEDEEGRICIIENVKTLVDDKMAALLIDSLDDASDTDAYWISKLLVETAKNHMDLIEKKIASVTDSSQSKYWLKKIIEHMKGVKYL